MLFVFSFFTEGEETAIEHCDLMNATVTANNNLRNNNRGMLVSGPLSTPGRGGGPGPLDNMRLSLGGSPRQTPRTRPPPPPPRRHRLTGERIDEVSAKLFPFLFTVFNITYWGYYVGKSSGILGDDKRDGQS